jgi:hypothetical protein
MTAKAVILTDMELFVDHQLVLQYLQALGFPICASLALGWALWRIGNRLMESHLTFMEVVRKQGDKAIDELSKQSAILSKWPSDPVKTICKVDELKDLIENAPADCRAEDIVKVLELQGRIKPKHT